MGVEPHVFLVLLLPTARCQMLYRASLLLSELRAEQCSGEKGVWPDMKTGDAIEVTVSLNCFVTVPYNVVSRRIARLIFYRHRIHIYHSISPSHPLMRLLSVAEYLFGLRLHAVSCSSQRCLRFVAMPQWISRYWSFELWCRIGSGYEQYHNNHSQSSCGHPSCAYMCVNLLSTKGMRFPHEISKSLGGAMRNSRWPEDLLIARLSNCSNSRLRKTELQLPFALVVS